MTELAQLEKQLESFERWQIALFALALSERMFPNFALFSKLVGFGDHAQLRQIIDGAWSTLANSGAKINAEVQLDNVDANIPNLDEYDMYGAMPAYDAAVALYSALNCMLEGDAEEAAAVANLSREGVATFIEVTEANDQMSDEELVRFINTHDLMLDEDAFQQELFERLSAQKQPTTAFVQALQQLAHNEGVSNIGISDDEDEA